MDVDDMDHMETEFSNKFDLQQIVLGKSNPGREIYHVQKEVDELRESAKRNKLLVPKLNFLTSKVNDLPHGLQFEHQINQ